ncbi:MAG: hypothetical protein ACOCUI_03020 [bacterium]
MKKISREHKEYLIKKNILKCKGGRYPDLTVVNRKNGKKQKYYVPEWYLKYLKE